MIELISLKIALQTIKKALSWLSSQKNHLGIHQNFSANFATFNTQNAECGQSLYPGILWTINSFSILFSREQEFSPEQLVTIKRMFIHWDHTLLMISIYFHDKESLMLKLVFVKSQRDCDRLL